MAGERVAVCHCERQLNDFYKGDNERYRVYTAAVRMFHLTIFI